MSAEERIERGTYDVTHQMLDALEAGGVPIDDAVAAYARACARQVAEIAETFRWTAHEGDDE
jgi:hypothetical protein